MSSDFDILSKDLPFHLHSHLRAKEISALTWSMVCDSEGAVSDCLNLLDKASKGKCSGRIIPLHRELKHLLILAKFQEVSLSQYIVQTERDKNMSAQTVVNFFLHFI